MKKHILVADDNVLMLEMYMNVLDSAGYEVRAARDGAEALRMLEEGDPDLVLLDIEMPELTGWQLLEIMRRRVEWYEIPVILVTALLEPSRAERESYPSYQCYVTKKATGVELLELIERVLGGSQAQAGPRAEVDMQQAQARSEDCTWDTPVAGRV